jgi:hypothetical protein
MSDLQKTRLPLGQIALTQEFLSLSAKRRDWVACYILGGMSGDYDAVAATKAVFKTANPKTVTSMSYALLADKKVQAVLDLHFGKKRDPLDDVLAQLATVIAKALRADKKRGRISVATVKAMQFYDKHAGKISATQPEAPKAKRQSPEHRFKVGDLVTQRDGAGVVHTGKVIEADSAGRPTRIETIS